ncbi:MAG: hypothetical protein ACQ9MH_26010 [Nitrospinales bacterium]|nr:hypothetical protein [Desulfobacteraceae bacterium]
MEDDGHSTDETIKAAVDNAAEEAEIRRQDSIKKIQEIGKSVDATRLFIAVLANSRLPSADISA